MQLDIQIGCNDTISAYSPRGLADTASLVADIKFPRDFTSTMSSVAQPEDDDVRFRVDSFSAGAFFGPMCFISQ